jgi:hypothetical protein
MLHTGDSPSGIDELEIQSTVLATLTSQACIVGCVFYSVGLIITRKITCRYLLRKTFSLCSLTERR